MHPYIPQTPDHESQMLRAIGLERLDDLFAEIPASIRDAARFPTVPPRGLPEWQVMDRLSSLAAKNAPVDRLVSFMGGGFYDHHVPSVVHHMMMRSEFYTAYTPYQPEVSQGTLQVIFEFQSLIASLTGMALSNASHYDGATALAESGLMAFAHHSKRREILVSAGVNARHRAVLRTYLHAAGHDISIVELGEDGRTRIPPPGMLKDAAAFVVGYPNGLGVIEDLEAIAKVKGDALLIVLANPIALGLLKSPGSLGADIVVGDGANLGNGVSFGGPGLGFMAVSEALMRRIPGRIVGKTLDATGKEGYVLTLQAREQHIRRQRAASNICTNQSLMALCATIYLSSLGRQGFRRIAENSFHHAHYLAARLQEAGVKRLHTGPFFQEFAVTTRGAPADVLGGLERRGFLAGPGLTEADGVQTPGLLVAATEKRTKDEMDRFVRAMGESHGV